MTTKTMYVLERTTRYPNLVLGKYVTKTGGYGCGDWGPEFSHSDDIFDAIRFDSKEKARYSRAFAMVESKIVEIKITISVKK